MVNEPFTPDQLEAEAARLWVQFGGTKTLAARLELAWAWATNREHYTLTDAAWEEIDREGRR
jgi:hypothetical protein